jgi:hypothetical protein
MATVPRVTGPSVEVRPTPFVAQSAEGATPDAFGAAAGRGMVQAGQQLAAFGEQVFRTAERIRLEEDRRAETEALTLLQKESNTITRGDGTAENPGYYGLAGQNAVDGYKASREALDAARARIAEGIKSERARTNFLTRSEAAIAAEDNTMLRHVTQQRKVAADATSEVQINTAVETAALFYTDPERVADQIAIVEQAQREIAQRNGITDPATVDGLVQARRTAAVSASVRAAVEQKDGASARALFVQYAGQINGREQAVLSGLIRNVVVTEEAQRSFQELWAKVKANGWSEVRAREEILKTVSGETADKVIQYMNGMFSAARQDRSEASRERSEARAEAQDTAFAENDRLMMSGMSRDEQRAAANQVRGQTGVLLRNLLDQRFRQEQAEERRLQSEAMNEALNEAEAGNDPRALPPEIWSRLTKPQRDQVEARYALRSSGAPVVSEAGAREEYMTLPLANLAAMPPEELSAARLRLSPSDFKDLQKRVEDAQNGRNTPGLAARSSDAAYIKTKLDDLGFNTSSNSAKQRRSSVFDLIDREIAVARESNDGRITDAERERIVRQAISTYIKDTSLFGGTFGRTLRENEEAGRQAEGMSREALRARQNAPIVGDLIARAFPSDRPAAGAAAAVAMLAEEPSSRNFPPAEINKMRNLLRRQGIEAPTPYQIRAALVYERERADFQSAQ